MKITESKTWEKIKGKFPSRLYNFSMDQYKKALSLSKRGSNAKCPICKKCFKYFVKGIECPMCASLPRQRLVYLFLKRKTGLFKEKTKFLHFAPEFCLYRKFSKMKNLEYIGTDIRKSPRSKKITDMEKISYPNSYFDFVMSAHVLEHVENDIKAMKETARVTKKEGFVIHAVPVDKSLEKTQEDKSVKTEKQRLEKYGHPDHRRNYGKDFKRRAEKAGFKVKKISAPDFLSKQEMKFFVIGKEEDVYFMKPKK